MFGSSKSNDGFAFRKLAISVLMIGLVFVVGVGAARVLIGLRPQAERVESHHQGYTVEVLEIQRRDYQHIISGFGTAAPIQTAELSAELNGIIKEIDNTHRVGTKIEQGQLLCKIDDEKYRQELAKKKSLLEESASDIKRIDQDLKNTRERAGIAAKERDFAQQEVARQLELREAGAGTEQTLEQKQRELQSAERFLLEIQNQIEVRRLERVKTDSTIRSRNADLKLAQLDLDHCEIRSPIAGVIAERNVDPGELVNSGTSLFRIVDMSVVEIPVQIPESESGAITLDAAVTVALPQDVNRTWEGTITRIAPEVDELNRTVAVYVQVENEGLDTQLRLGQLVEARINGVLYADAVILPRRALIDGFAFVKEGDSASRREPDILRALGDELILNDGVNEGENLIISNLEVLYDGAKVITSAELNKSLSDTNEAAKPETGS
jgi:multidrug efflux pump subunit AcrA (membrane-fusion protein)